MRYDHLLFDADGTLYDFTATEEHAIHALLNESGIEPSPSTLAMYAEVNSALWKEFEHGSITIQKLKVERFRRFFARVGSDTDSTVASERYVDLLAQGDHVYPWTLPLLQQLAKQGFRLTLITNGIAKVQRGRLAATNTLNYFDSVVISEEIGVQKPDPRFFDSFLAADEGVRRRALVIGDSLSSDIAGGLAAGIDTCWFNPDGNTAPALLQPTWTITKMDQLLHLLDASV